MKSQTGFLSICLLLAVLLLSSPLRAAFKMDIHINSAENPTLTFGEADTRACSPHPPFSGMFGVADVCFANPGNTEEWFDRLAEDIKTANDANQWILVAKSNARLTFNLTSGSIPDGLKIVYNDPKSGDKKTAAMAHDLSFAVKTGGVYTITRGETPATDPNANNNLFVQKGGTAEFTIPAGFTPKTMNIAFAAGLGILAHFEEDLTPRGITLADVDWIIKVNYDGGTVAYNWTVPYTELQVTLTPTRAGGDPIVTMTPNRSSAKPISSTITTLGEDPETQKIVNVIDWILQKFGTLDFDGSGKITTDDVMYLYNFYQNDCDPDTSIDDIKDFNSANSNDSKRMIALEWLKNNTDDLKFSGDSKVTMDDVMFMYNFVQNDCDPDTSPGDITDFNSSSANQAKREAALISLKECVE